MSEYVYAYIHPEHGWVYVGRTSDLAKRIQQHDGGTFDNIGREYVELLRDSSVYYIELNNKAEAVCVEAYLINTKHPYLNKSLKYESDMSAIKMELPKFARMLDADRIPSSWPLPKYISRKPRHQSGCPPAEITPLFEESVQKWLNGDITATEGMKRSGVERTTWYKLSKQYLDDMVAHEFMSERTRNGLVAAKARGRSGGRPRIGSPEIIAAALSEYDLNIATNKDIAKRYGVSTATLSRWIADRKYSNSRNLRDEVNNAEPTQP